MLTTILLATATATATLVEGPGEAASTGAVFSGTSLPRYTIARPTQTAASIRAKANGVVAALGNQVTLDQTALQTWATLAAANPTEFTWGRFVVDDPRIIVGYRPRENEVIVMNTYYLNLRPTTFPLPQGEDVGETAARDVMEDTVDVLSLAGVIHGDISGAAATTAYMREHEDEGGGVTRDWITEYQFTMNRTSSGITLPDVGLTVGVHRKGIVSSIRYAELTATKRPNVATSYTMTQARSQLLSDLRASYPTASVQVLPARQGALLAPTSSSETVDPSGIFNFVVLFPGGNVSHQKIARVSLVTGAVEHLY